MMLTSQLTKLTFCTMLFSLMGCSTVTQMGSLNHSAVMVPLEVRPADFEPIKEQDGNMRVIIRTKQPIHPKLKEKQNLLALLQQSLDRELGKQSLSVVDRQLNQMIQNEIDIASKYDEEAGRHNADIMLLVVIDDYDTRTSSSTETSTLSTIKHGLLNREGHAPTHGECRYQSQFSGFLRIQTIPELTQLDQFEFSKKDDDVFNVDNQSQCAQGFSSHIAELNRKLLDNVVCQNKYKITDSLMPTGHVLSAEKTEEDLVLQVSLGSDMGVSVGDTLRIYHELSSTPYAEAKIISISAKLGQARLSQLNANQTIYENDYVKPHTRRLMSNLGVNCLF